MGRRPYLILFLALPLVEDGLVLGQRIPKVLSACQDVRSAHMWTGICSLEPQVCTHVDRRLSRTKVTGEKLLYKL